MRNRYDPQGRLLSKTLPSQQRLAYRYHRQPDGAVGALARIELIRWPSWLDGFMVLAHRYLPDTWAATRVIAEFNGPESNPTAPLPSDLAEPGPVEAGLSPAASGQAHDLAGLPHLWAQGDAVFQLRWNSAGQLVEVTRSGEQQPLASYRYDARGRRASKDTAQGTEFYFYEGTQLLAVVKQSHAPNKSALIQSEYVYAGYCPLAWLRADQVLHLQTDARCAVQAAHARAEEPPLWQAHLNAWGLASAQPASAADMDPGLRLINQFHDPETGLHYQLARYYDPKAGRFISPDPAGVSDSLDAATPDALKLDLSAYAAGQPWRFFDPDGAAKISYYAITTNASQSPLGQTQGFTKARWAFVIEDIQPGGDLQSEAGRRRQDYAQQATWLLFDGDGSFIPGYAQAGVQKSDGGKALVWSGQADVPQAFASHYGEARISMSNFIIEDMDDDAAAQLIWYFSQSARARGSCKNEAPGWLPDIRFAPGEDSIRVTQDKGVDTQRPANKQRILNCQPATTLPVHYADDAERRRLLKYQAAAELQESAAPSAIYKDCGPDACRSRTDITVNGHSYYASYGRTQFVTETFLRTLKDLIPSLSPQERDHLGLNQAVVLPNGRNGTMADMALLALDSANSAALAFTYHRKKFGKALSPEQAERAWGSLSETDKAKFMRDTGLGKTEFMDMLGYQPEGRARTEAEGQNAFGSEAANRLLDGTGQTTFKNWLMGFYQSQDAFNFVSQRFMQDNLRTILDAPPIKDRFINPETPGTEAHRQAQTQIENDLMSRVAGLHNSGSWELAVSANPTWPQYVVNYVKEFSSTAGRGDWRSLRCSDELQKTNGLQLTPISL